MKDNFGLSILNLTIEDTMKIYERDVLQKQLKQLYDYNIYATPPTYIPHIKHYIMNKADLKPIAFYLPQYYPTAINNQNWGKGFTEWTNVARAVPQYLGHYQPHIPESLGYYDLRNEKIMEEQCRMAMNYGIYGFCFYYYYFSGKTQLELPLINFATNSKIQFPFCLCWANENWTRKWDGRQQDVLLKQTYDSKYMKDFIARVAKYFLNDNYIKINNRPVLIIYNAKAIDNLEYCLEYWKNYCRQNGFGEVFLICAKTFGLNDPYVINMFDACVEFPPHDIHTKLKIDYSKLTNPDYFGSIYHIMDYINNIPEDVPYRIFRCAFPSWDNTARVGRKSKIFSDASPDTFEIWLQKIINDTIKNHSPEARFFFINAWNEWGEGAHLEPDRKYGYAYLECLRKCIERGLS